MLLYIIHLWEKFAVKINVSDQNPKVVSVLYTKKILFLHSDLLCFETYIFDSAQM